MTRRTYLESSPDGSPAPEVVVGLPDRRVLAVLKNERPSTLLADLSVEYKVYTLLSFKAERHQPKILLFFFAEF